MKLHFTLVFKHLTDLSSNSTFTPGGLKNMPNQGGSQTYDDRIEIKIRLKNRYLQGCNLFIVAVSVGQRKTETLAPTTDALCVRSLYASFINTISFCLLVFQS